MFDINREGQYTGSYTTYTFNADNQLIVTDGHGIQTVYTKVSELDTDSESTTNS